MQSQDLSQHLNEQLEFLRASAAAFDTGMEAEAKRLAVQIRLLVYDARGGRKNRSVSLLTQLGVRENLPWLDTAIAPDPDLEFDFSCGLCRLRGEEKGTGLRMSYAAPLDDLGPDRQRPPAAFIDWWAEPVLADRLNHVFSREDFVRFVADQDGGAHVDAKLGESYEALTRRNSMQIASNPGMLGFVFGPTSDKVAGPEHSPGSSVALASVRQIAHEVLATLERALEMDDQGVHGVRCPICPLSISAEMDARRIDPCPCGSGRKFKRCFGVRAPRNPRHTHSAAIAMS